MTAKPNDFKLGLFVLGGIGLLLAALFVFGASKFFEGKTVEETYVADEVEGLKVGAPVLLRGVPVGEVTRINFSWNVYHRAEPRYVVVEFEVGNKVSLVPPGSGYAERVQEQVAQGLRARIKSQGLAGATILSLEYVKNPADFPPLPAPWTPRHIYIPSAPGRFSQIIASLETISGNLKEINFQRIGTQVQQDLATVETLLNHFDQANVAGLSTNLNALVTDLRGVSTRLQAFVGQTNEPASANLQKISADADKILAS
ncbi:MAG TPA: MlaD family protein, partial [Bacillota bacterium]|nr:MlaD family protein [Bacillota bacterium]